MASALRTYYRNVLTPGAAITDPRALGDGFETDVFAYELSGGGETRDLVLRLYPKGDHALLRARNEDHVMRHLHAAGYPVPEVLHFQPDQSHLGGAFLIMERAPGSALQSQLKRRPELLDTFCRLLYELHRVDWRPFIGVDGPWPTLDEAEATFSLTQAGQMAAAYGLAEAFAPVFGWLADRGRGLEAQLAVVHGDFHPLNVLVDEAGIPTVLDWGSTCVGDRRIDVANAMIMAHVFGQSELAPAILDRYQALAGEQVSDLDYFLALVITRRLLVMLVVMLHGGAVVGLRDGTEEHLRQNGHLARLVGDQVIGLTGLDLPELRRVLAQF